MSLTLCQCVQVSTEHKTIYIQNDLNGTSHMYTGLQNVHTYITGLLS